MKKIKSIIVLLFVLFSVQAIAQTKYTIHENPGTSSHPSNNEPYRVRKDIETDEGGTYSFTYYTNLTNAFNFVKQNASNSEVIFDGVSGTISYDNQNTLNCNSLKLLNNSDITLNNLKAIVTNSVNITSGRLKLNELNCSSTVSVYGTLEITTGNIHTLYVYEKVYTNNLTISNNVTVYDNKILKVATGGYENQGSESFSENSIIIGINRPYTKTLTLEGGMWNTIGFPNNNGITHLATDGLPEIWALSWNYNNNTWNDTYLTIDNYTNFHTGRGKGFFAFPEISESATGNYSIALEATNADLDLTYPGPRRSSYEWFCLANPFTHSISIEKFLRKNVVQGGIVYLDNGETYRSEYIGIIKPLQGFFVNIADNPTINFKLDELFYPSPVKSEVEEVVNYIDIDVLTDDYAVPVTFLHKETALAEYDIFDADKMFGSGAVAEPYFVLGERNLCIEAANTLPYTAPMNIKSGEARNVQIVVSHIPEQYEVTLVDGEEEITLEAGVAYETMIASGENEDRFKVIINKKNSVSISDVENVSEIFVRNLNRNIIIEGGKNIYTEIFNMLGQKVYETADRNFMLNKVDAGAYVVKVKDGNSVSTTKIVVK